MQKGKVVKVMTQIGITRKGITQIGITQTGITQIGITQIGITQIGITQTGISQIGITPTNQRPWEGTGHAWKSKNKSLRIFWSVFWEDGVREGDNFFVHSELMSWLNS